MSAEPGEASEAECAVCGRWPPTIRQAMRFAINALPLREPVCAGCLVAFWANIAAKAKGQRPN